MTEIRTTGDWDGSTFAHEAFVFETDQQLVDRVVPFAAEGFAKGEPVLVVAGQRVRELLTDALGEDVHRCEIFAPAETWWQGGHQTLHAYDRSLRELKAAVPSWRLAAEPVWLATEAGEEWSRFESVANRCYATMPYYSLCLHDRTLLSAPVLDAVCRTHPLTWGGLGPVPTATYEEPERFLRAVQPPWEQRPGHAQVELVTSPRQARRASDLAATDGWSRRADDVVLATHELVVNALRAAPFAEVSTWTDGDTLVLQVADGGPGLPDETRGYVPPGADLTGGRGMWVAWSLADDAAVASGRTGTAIRLYFRR
jgi:MEDS: MEthanogen/methylotroph, DcmR Sensory domain/Histidine kinase-like ATPase domain